jgi:hypothetical protein
VHDSPTPFRRPRTVVALGSLVVGVRVVVREPAIRPSAKDDRGKQPNPYQQYWYHDPGLHLSACQVLVENGGRHR